MSEQRHDASGPADGKPTIAALARQQNAGAVRDPRELAADVWESDEELDAFLTDLRISRNASPA